MSTNFNWHTDEDDRWDEIETTPPPTPAPRRRWRWLLPLLLAAVAIGVVVWQLSRQVNETTTAVSQDVLASHEIVMRAAASEDIELFTSVLSGREASWTEAQKQLLRGGQLLDYPQFGLIWLGPAAAPTAEAVTVAPDLRAATVAAEQLYGVAIGNGLTETIRLRRHDVYRQGSNRWLLAPPLDEYWGPERTIEVGRVRITYPARDEEFVSAFALDLDEKVAELCRLYPDLSCADSRALNVNFDRAPGVLFSSHYADVAWQATSEIRLPAPSLLGTPVDDDAYFALFRGYASAILQQLVGAWVGYDCCAQGLLFQALVDFQLNQLALRPWPLRPADYEQLLLRGESFLFDPALWDATVDPERESDIWRHAYALVALSQAGSMRPSLVAMERELETPGSHFNWINRFIARTTFEQDPERSWRQFIYAHSRSVNRPQPVAWPAQEVYLTCNQGPAAAETQLISFNPATGLRQVLTLYDAPVQMSPLPGAAGVVLTQSVADGHAADRVIIWHNGGETAILSSLPQAATPNYTGRHDPAGRWLVFSFIQPLDVDQSDVTPNGIYTSPREYALLDWQACATTTCGLQPLAGLPLWSPAGTHTLLFDNRRNLLLGNENGQVVAQFDYGTLREPFWLNEDQFAFIADNQLQLGHVDLRPAVSLLDDAHYEALVAGLAVADREQLVFKSILAHQAPADRLTFLVADLNQTQARLVTLNVGTKNLTIQGEVDPATIPLNTGPDGQWLLLRHDRPALGRSQFSIYPAAKPDAAELTLTQDIYANDHFLDWSANGDWLVSASDSYLHFLAPAYEYQRLLFLEQGANCAHAVWVNAGQEVIAVDNAPNS